LENLIDKDKIQATKWFQRFGDVRSERHKCIRKAFKDLMKRFGAHPERDREFVAVSMTCGDKEEAALIVNEMVTLFLASQGVTEQREIKQKLVNLENEKLSVQRDLDAAERSLEEVRERWGIVDLEDPRGRYIQNPIEIKLNDLELEQTDLLLNISQLQVTMEALERQATGPVTEQVEALIENDPTTVLLTQQLEVLKARLAGTLTTFGENHRSMRQLREQINETRVRKENRRAEIAEQTRQANLQNGQDALVMLLGRLEELEKQRKEAETKKRDLDLARIQYAQRLAIRDERREMLDAVKAQIESYRIIHDDPETPKVLSVGPAPEPLEVSSPRWEFYFPGGTVLGLLCGVGLAFLIEMLNDLVRTPRDVGKYLHIPLLGVIPDAAEDKQVRDVDLCHVVRQAPYSVISESYRRFRANLKLSGSAESLKVLLVSSGMPGDGTTSVSVNLAATLVAENKKVLLIDANFRCPSLQKIFPKAESGGAEAGRGDLGLSTLLTGLCSYEDAKRSNIVEGLDIIDSGPLPSNPAELLGSPQMQQLIKDRRNSHDYVIIDGPPVLLVSDAKVLAKFVDGTALVFNAGATRRGAAQRTIQELGAVNATITGCVLFAVRAMKGGYFQEQFRSYQRYQKLQLAHSV
jgi:capsular exopolysaccharide synthesis family protein